MNARFTIVGIGEALFDIIRGEARLGGAPLNVAVQAHQLGEQKGVGGVVVSRVGQDDLGRDLIDALRQRGMSVDHIQTDPDRDTGRVYVDIDASGEPRFQIVENVAWDVLGFEFNDDDLARRCHAVCFGTLAQRDGQARNAIYRFLDTAKNAIRLYDANLRENCDDRRIISRSCQYATALKVNEAELPLIAEVFGLAAEGRGEMNEADHKARALIRKCDLDWLALTRGARGTVLYHADGRHVGQAVGEDIYPRHDDADTVGAGDACSAALLVGHALRLGAQRIVDVANHIGAFVASQPGATPQLPDSIKAMLD